MGWMHVFLSLSDPSEAVKIAYFVYITSTEYYRKIKSKYKEKFGKNIQFISIYTFSEKKKKNKKKL